MGNAAQYSNRPAQSQTKPDYQIDEHKIGVPYVKNKYWKMVRDSATRSLSRAFAEQQIDCYQVIVATSGHTIVHESIILDKRQHFKLCEIYGANWDQPDLNGVTPLMKAVALNRLYYVERLLQLGANPQLKDNRGMTAVDYGQLYESYDSIDLIQKEDQ